MTEDLLPTKIAHANRINEGGPEHETLLAHLPTARILISDAIIQILDSPTDPALYHGESNPTPLGIDTPPIPEETGHFLREVLLHPNPQTLKLVAESSRRHLKERLLSTQDHLSSNPNDLTHASLPDADDVADLLVLNEDHLSPTQPDPISHTLATMQLQGMFDPSQIPADYDKFIEEKVRPIWGDIHTFIRRRILDKYELAKLKLETRNSSPSEKVSFPQNMITRANFLLQGYGIDQLERAQLYQNLLSAGQIKIMLQTMTDHGTNITQLINSFSHDNIPLDQLLSELLHSDPTRLTELASATSLDFATFAEHHLNDEEQGNLVRQLNHPIPEYFKTTKATPVEASGLALLSPSRPPKWRPFGRRLSPNLVQALEKYPITPLQQPSKEFIEKYAGLVEFIKQWKYLQLPWSNDLANLSVTEISTIMETSQSLASQLHLNVRVEGSEQSITRFFADLQNIPPDQIEDKLRSALTPTSNTQIAEATNLGFYQLIQKDQSSEKGKWLLAVATFNQVIARESARIAEELKTANPSSTATILESIFKPIYLSDSDQNAEPQIFVGLSNQQQG